jgi:alpha-beta hydrolase superfamily lysophospholipase
VAPETSRVAGDERSLPGLTPALRARLRAVFRLLGWLSPPLAARLAARLLLTPLGRRPDAGESAFLATARAHHIDAAGNRVQAYEWDGAGPTVLIVHGWISHSARFAPLIQALRARGFRVIAFDAPAHGRSGGRRADLNAFRAALEGTAARLGPVHAVVAHSFGALCTAGWLGGAPLPSVRCAVLVGLMRDLDYLFDSFVSALALSPGVTTRLRARLVRRYGAGPEQFSARALAAHIRVPVLLMHGEQDEFVPSAHADEIAEQLIDGRVVIVAGHRHSQPLRDGECIAVMTEFVARHATPGH